MSLSSFFRILLARWLLTASLLVLSVGAALAVTLYLPSTYTATTELVLDGDQDMLSGQMLPANTRSAYIATQVDVAGSRNVAEKVFGLLSPEERALAEERAAAATNGQLDAERWIPRMLERNLRVNPGRNSSVLRISVDSQNTDLAAALANAHAEAYIRTSLDLRTEPAQRFSDWYEEELDVLRENLREARRNLSSYQQEHRIAAADERLDVENERLRELSSLLVAAQGERLQDDLRQSRENDAEWRESSADVLNNPVVQELRAELARAEARLDDVTTRYGVNHPTFRRAEAEVDSLTRRLENEKATVDSSMRSVAGISAQRVEELEAAVERQRERVLELNARRDEMELLQQEVSNAQEAYNAASSRASTSRLESRLGETDIAVLNAAVPPMLPSAPDIRLNLVVAAALGLLLGIGLSLLLELRNRRVRSRADIEEHLGLPVLAHLPGKRRRLTLGVDRP
ncbi:MAG: chain length determinant protein EpsF [Ectothiorhodospiraceae bacterium]|nr:chain length determinant protein EpsF [Ectothiorhodospiraceae bacterium]